MDYLNSSLLWVVGAFLSAIIAFIGMLNVRLVVSAVGACRSS